MNDLMESPTTVVTEEQLALIKRTVAQGATDDELRLYLFDCQRQGVHPLDKLIHYTKRGGKYVPITSIDFMRQRAAATGDYLGCAKPTWKGTPGKPGFSVELVAKRLIHGTHVAEHWAEAHWEEYYPGEQSGHMWRKMPHVMLAKVCEALALRKGFPKELAGLYAKEEMDQATGPVLSPTSDALAPNTLIDGIILDYTPKVENEPHKIRVALQDGDLTFTQHRLPCSEAMLTACQGDQVKLAYRKVGKFMELTEIQPMQAQPTATDPVADDQIPSLGPEWMTGVIKAYGHQQKQGKKPFTVHKFDFMTMGGEKYTASKLFDVHQLSTDFEWTSENIELAVNEELHVHFKLEQDGKYYNLVGLELA